MELFAGLSTLAIVALIIVFLCALPGLLTGWMLKASGRSFFWGFVLGTFFGPLGFLVAVVFLLVGKPAQQQFIQPPMPQNYYEVPPALAPRGRTNTAVEIVAVMLIVLSIGIIGFVAYSVHVEKNQPPKIRPQMASVLPVQPARNSFAAMPSPSATPSLEPSVEPSTTATPTGGADSEHENSQSLTISDEPLNAHGVVVQELPGNFRFKRETGQETGVPVFILVPREEAMAYDAERGNTFEAVGMLCQPEREKFGILFFNAKEQLQLQGQEQKGVLLRIDGEEFKFAEYLPQKAEQAGKLKIEGATIAIDRKIFEKMVKADDIFIRVGAAMYSLDQDNIDALHYYGAEIAKDLARRSKRNR